jgi:PAS domain S-box-containing protein
MKDEDKTKEELVREMAEMRRYIAGLEKTDADHRKAAEALVESEWKFSAAFRYSPVSIALTAPFSGRIIDVNDTFLKSMEYTREEVIGRTTTELEIFANIEDRSRLIEELKAQKFVFGSECRFRTKSGRIRTSILSITFLPVKGEIVQLSIAIDITERKQMEEALRESEEKYRTVVEKANEAIIIAQDGKLAYVNPKFAAIFGLPVEELTGRPFEGLIHQDDRAMVMDRHRRRLNGELIPDSYEFRTISKTRGLVWFYISAQKILWNGKPATLNMLTDITERKRVEEALRESETMFRNLFEQHAAVKLIIDPDDGAILDANARAVEFYGWTRDQFRGMKIQDINTLSPDEVQQEMEKARASKRVHFDFRHRLADGSVRDVEVYSSMIDARGKELLHSIVHDVTERKRLEEEREKLIGSLQKALSEIKQLSGLLPICSSCKKIRNDEGYWEQLEIYIKNHSDADFSHGICPECVARLYPDLDKGT